MDLKKNSIASEHLSTAFKYAGISFIAGAINHGFFSESRSIYTALLGIGFFIIGTFLELKKNATVSFARDFLISAFFSIGLGFLTGGLQHFPDSPLRSMWVVPTGFIISLAALIILKNEKCKKSDYAYGFIGTTFVVILCYALFKYFSMNGSTFQTNHHHMNEANESESIQPPKSSKDENIHHHSPGTKPHND